MFGKAIVAAFMFSAISVSAAATASAASPWWGPNGTDPNDGAACRAAEDENHSSNGGVPGAAYTCEYKTDQPEGPGWYFFYQN